MDKQQPIEQPQDDFAVAQNERPAEHKATVAHRPATALPWKQGIVKAGEQADDETVEDCDGEIVADCGARALLDGVEWADCAQNAAYIVHAANNYERLVDALQEARLQLEYLHDRYTPTSSGEAVISRTTGLLTELGEL